MTPMYGLSRVYDYTKSDTKGNKSDTKSDTKPENWRMSSEEKRRK
jgi:hypothetical protein